jgi:myo-inositol-1(or 4)-monophosphatase
MMTMDNLVYCAPMMTVHTGTDAEVAVAAARAGAAVVRGLSGSPVARFGKPGGDFATDADLRAERAIVAVIRAARPADAVTGEEGGSSGAGDARRRWLVDPLCGTLNYAARPTPRCCRSSDAR